jgi:hypothetical protein
MDEHYSWSGNSVDCVKQRRFVEYLPTNSGVGLFADVLQQDIIIIIVIFIDIIISYCN